MTSDISGTISINLSLKVGYETCVIQVFDHFNELAVMLLLVKTVAVQILASEVPPLSFIPIHILRNNEEWHISLVKW